MSNTNNNNTRPSDDTISDALLRSSQHHHHHHHPPFLAGADSAPPPSSNHATSTPVTEEDQLSADLALFLSHPSLRAALADGSLDLKSYSATVQAELQQLESQCIAQYRQHYPTVQQLERDAETCHAVLSQLHEMLLGFRADLGGLSGEIRQLQAQSRQLDVQLRNRRRAEQLLRHFLQHCILSPATAQALLTGPVNTTFVQAVQELQTLYQNCTSNNSNNSTSWSCGVPITETVAGQEMQQHLRTLLNVATKRSRDHLLQQMALLRRPQTHIRLLQVHGLLKYAALYDFLQDTNEVIAQELFHVYCESMQQTLQQLFRTYVQQLQPLDRTVRHVTRADVVAMEEAVLRERSSSNSTSSANRTDIFALGLRAHECLAPSAMPIAAHVALLQQEQFPYERLFASWLGHLLEAVTNEHVFGRQFFKRDTFPQLFPATLSLLTEQLENYLFSCHDALCLLLMIKVTHAYKRRARQRKIHSLDSFLDQITHLLWPRLKTVMEGHWRSIEQADATKLGLLSSNDNTSKSSISSSGGLHAHYVSRRFAEFCCSLLLILHDTTNSSSTSDHHHSSSKSHAIHHRRGSSLKSSPSIRGNSAAAPESDRRLSASVTTTPGDSGGTANTSTATTAAAAAAAASPMTAGDQLLQDLHNLLDAFLQLLERLAEEVHGTQNKKRVTVFLINNLDTCVGIFQERRLGQCREHLRLSEQLVLYREQFVEVELLTYFSKMIAFVQQTEAYLVAQQQGGSGKSTTNLPSYDSVNLAVVEALAVDFATQWKTAMEQINREILSYFSNFRNGMEILKHCLTQLLLYYTRFQDIIRKVWKKTPPSVAKDLVATNVILAEIKKYALAI